MNRIDQEYRKRFKQQSFPESLKRKGWSDARKMLDAEMPVRSSTTSKFLKYGGILALALLTSFTAWYFMSDPEISNNAGQGDSISNNTPGLNMPSIQPAGKETEANSPDITESPEVSADTENESADNSKEIPEVTNTGQTSSSNNLDNDFGSTDENVESRSQPDPVIADKGQSEMPALPPASEQQEQRNISGSEENISETMEEPAPAITDPIVLEESQATDQEEGSEPVESPQNNQLLDTTASEIAAESEVGVEAEELLMEVENEGTTDTQIETANESADSISVNSPPAVINYQHLAFEGLDESVPPISEKADFNWFSRERFSLSLWMNYAYTGKILSSGNDDYLHRRQTEERAVWTPATGFSLDYFLGNNRTVGIGISFQEYGEEVSYTSMSVVDSAYIDGRFNSPDEFPTAIRVDSVRIIDSINVGHWNYTVFFTRKGNDSLQIANGRSSWRYIEIPLTYGFRFGSGPVRLWLRPGFSLGIPIRTDFRYISHRQTAFLQDRGEINSYVAPVQLSAIFNIGIDVHLSRRWSLRLNGVSSMQLNSALREEGVSQRYYRLGGGIELGYNF